MGASKRHQRNTKFAPQMRSRTTRSKGKPISDPAQNTQALTEQLRAMGLYAADTLGDGNCLFRALSDQLHGTEGYHLQLRHEVCNWIEAHKDRYAPFCDDERGLETHLRCMRQPATYGGHMELSAFAHMSRRDVKVIQPGLVYVIEWAAGGDIPTISHDTYDPGPSSEPETSLDESILDARELRRLRREKKREATEKGPPPPVYVAYHDWEHFSSIRNIDGPTTGPPCVKESPLPDDAEAPASPITPKKKPSSRAKPKSSSGIKSASKRSVASDSKAPLTLSAPSQPPAAPSTPSQIPLPASRSPSPMLSSVPPSSVASIASSSISHTLRTNRSPKRSFDESSGSSQSGASESAAKRTRNSRSQRTSTEHSDRQHGETNVDLDADDADADTPGLSASGFTTESSVSSSASSPVPTPPPYAPATPKPTMTRRERKKLGLPKSRTALVGSATRMSTRSSGRIVIPGGKCSKK